MAAVKIAAVKMAAVKLAAVKMARQHGPVKSAPSSRPRQHGPVKMTPSRWGAPTSQLCATREPLWTAALEVLARAGVVHNEGEQTMSTMGAEQVAQL
uniref:Uncharacterized protein n=1 Tax=Trichuris muris TaxID=70415 RepID=A0A5S6PZ81_TRIMR